jgi:hypothetical protein
LNEHEAAPYMDRWPGACSISGPLPVLALMSTDELGNQQGESQ